MKFFISTNLNSTELLLSNLRSPIAEAFTSKRIINETIDKKLLNDQVRAHILFEVIVYSILFVIGSSSNLLVLYKLTLSKRKTSLNILISQLNVADLIVILLTIPIEIFFDLTTLKAKVNLWGQNTFCQLLQTLRTFGFYLSSMILISISIDRYYAFVHPLTFYNTRDRNKRMVIIAWIASILLSIPQSTIIHLKSYPQVQGLKQCVTFGYLDDKYIAAFINMKSIIALYFAPLIVIIYCYVRIIIAIHRIPDFMKDTKRISKKNSILKTQQAKFPKLPYSRSFPVGLNLEQASFSLKNLEQEQVKQPLDKFELNSLNSENLLNLKKEKLFQEMNDELLLNKDKIEDYKSNEKLINKLQNFKFPAKLNDKLNEKIKDKINEKLIDKFTDKKLKEVDEQTSKLNKKLNENLNDRLIDNEILLVSSIPDDQIRKRRASRPRIILNKRSDSLSMPRERAKINLDKNKKLVKDLRKIETKDFELKIDKENKNFKTSVKYEKDEKETSLIKKLATKKKAHKFLKSKTSKLVNLLSKTKFKHSRGILLNKKKSSRELMKPIKLVDHKLERSRSQEEFSSNLKFKKSSRLLDDLHVSDSLINHQLYSREILMSRAKRKTLKVTILIVLAFVTCWTPYVTIALWYQVFEESARKVNEWVQELFFLLAVANSCVNGLVVYIVHM